MQNADLTTLVQACLEGREAGWTEFVRRYGNLIYATILRVDLGADDTEEAFQLSVVAMHERLRELRDPSRLVPWIIGISYRQAINRIRSRRREVSVDSISEAMMEASGLHTNTEQPPDDLRVRLEQQQSVAEALDQLPDRCQRLLRSLFFEEPSPEYEEIARREGIPIGSIGPTRARCLDKLRRTLQRGGSRPDGGVEPS